MGRLNVTLCGIELDNPVIPASGTFGFGYEFADYYDINELGTFSFKGTCLEEQDAVRRAAGLRPVILANVELSVGETYLFCVHITEDGRVLHHTLLQFAFPDESDDAAVIRRVCAAEQ